MTLLVEFAQLQAAVDRMAQFGAEVEACLHDVDQTMTALRATWHGDASEAQADAQARWDEGADGMKLALAQMCSVAQRAHDNYNDAARQNKAMWGV